MPETYTFSRALHMMRYGGLKMKPIAWESGCYVKCVLDATIIRVCNEYIREECRLSSDEIMGSWEIHKDEKPTS